TPAEAASKCKPATIPARAVPTVKVEAVATAFVHKNAHSDLIDEIAAAAIQSVNGKGSCIRLCCNEKRAGRNGQAQSLHRGFLPTDSPKAEQRAKICLLPGVRQSRGSDSC